MDYLEWELERQREALAALLLGGGAERTEEAGRGREAPGEAELDGGGAPARREAAERARMNRREELTAPSAWEGVLRARREGDRRERRDAGTAEVYGAAAAADFPDEGTGVREGTGEEDSPRWAVRRAPEAAGSGTVLPAGERFGEADGGTWGPGGAPGDGGEIAGRRAFDGQSLAGRPGAVSGGGFPALGRRSGSEGAEMLALPVLRETAEGGEAALSGWAGGRGVRTEAEDGARALSRAVQRDARRYDGGFAIY